MKTVDTAKLLKGLCFTALLAGPAAFADSQEYLWQSQAFRPAAGCDVKTIDKTELAILEDSKSLSDLRALIRVNEADRSFKIVAVSSRSSLNNKDNHKEGLEAAEQLKNQELSSSNQLDLSEFALKVTRSSQSKIGTSGVALQGAHFQVAMEDSDFVVFSCAAGSQKKDFLAFDVFVAANPTAIARVGVSVEDMSLFQNVQIVAIDEAEENLNKEQRRLEQKNQLPAPRVVDFRQSTRQEQKNDLSILKPSESKSVGIGSSAPVKPALVANVAVATGTSEQVICSDKSVAVLNESLSQTLFQASNGESIQVVQSFGNDRQTRAVEGQTKTFLKVSFKDRSGSSAGWVDAADLKLKSECVSSATPETNIAPVLPESDDNGIKSAVKQSKDSSSSAKFVFPTIARPKASYKTDMRRFKAGRKAGRLHAACDLYRVKGERTQSVGTGTVVRGTYFFYQGTYALELRLADGRIARYGEITGKTVPGSETGRSVKAGQNLGFIGKVNSGCCDPMLHFEMYKGNTTGPLTQKWRKGFQRRSDLLNPTDQLTEWEKQTYGASY